MTSFYSMNTLARFLQFPHTSFSALYILLNYYQFIIYIYIYDRFLQTIDTIFVKSFSIPAHTVGPYPPQLGCEMVTFQSERFRPRGGAGPPASTNKRPACVFWGFSTQWFAILQLRQHNNTSSFFILFSRRMPPSFLLNSNFCPLSLR